jgi:hypothetical protein
MRRELTRVAFSFLFLSIFFSKMVISAAPFVLSHIDRSSVKDVIMQLEIEDDASNTEKKDTPVKEYVALFYPSMHLPEYIRDTATEAVSPDHAKHTQSFHPPVPTPPPNTRLL